MDSPLFLALVIVGTSALTALAALFIAAALLRRKPAMGALQAMSDGSGNAHFVFEDRALIDANDRAQALLDIIRHGPASELHGEGDDLGPLLLFLEPQFPGLRRDLATLAERGRITLTAANETGYTLQADWRAGLAHLTFVDTRAEGSLVSIDRFSFAAIEDELETLRHCAGNAPALIWREDADGNVIWANGAYLDLTARAADDLSDLCWPLPKLFAAAADDGAVHIGLQLPGEDDRRVFEHSSVPCGPGRVHYAIPADAAARSEHMRRELLQTLARAFSTLPVGLAVFDRARRLKIFNPALVDLTGLSAGFLAAQPNLEQLLHALREARILPEPRDYKTWRADLLEMERAAEENTYEAEWLLPDGRTVNVTGRPHPDGGLAFFFDDVTSETRLARSFRAQIEAGQAVLDTLPDPMAVFSAEGTVILANTGYHALWNTAPESVVGQCDLGDALRLWQSVTQPSPIWENVAQMVRGEAVSPTVDGSVALDNGRILSVAAQALPGRNTIVRFASPHATTRAPEPATTSPVHRAHAELLARTLAAADPETPRAAAIPRPMEPQGASPQTPRTARVRHISSRSGAAG